MFVSKRSTVSLVTSVSATESKSVQKSLTNARAGSCDVWLALKISPRSAPTTKQSLVKTMPVSIRVLKYSAGVLNRED